MEELLPQTTEVCKLKSGLKMKRKPVTGLTN